MDFQTSASYLAQAFGGKMHDYFTYFQAVHHPPQIISGDLFKNMNSYEKRRKVQRQTTIVNATYAFFTEYQQFMKDTGINIVRLFYDAFPDYSGTDFFLFFYNFAKYSFVFTSLDNYLRFNLHGSTSRFPFHHKPNQILTQEEFPSQVLLSANIFVDFHGFNFFQSTYLTCMFFIKFNIFSLI